MKFRTYWTHVYMYIQWRWDMYASRRCCMFKNECPHLWVLYEMCRAACSISNFISNDIHQPCQCDGLSWNIWTPLSIVVASNTNPFLLVPCTQGHCNAMPITFTEFARCFTCSLWSRLPERRNMLWFWYHCSLLLSSWVLRDLLWRYAMSIPHNTIVLLMHVLKLTSMELTACFAYCAYSYYACHACMNA